MKNKVNLTIIEDLVGTQYGDMTGLIQIDGHNSVSELFSLCEEKGIDMEKYFLVGFGYSDFSTDGIGNRDNAQCSVLLLEKVVYGGSFDEISNNLKKSNNIKLIRKRFELKYTDFKKYIKRVDTMLLTELSSYISKAEIIDNEE